MVKKISIGIPVYNGEQYIKDTIDSLLSQTFKNFEVIISDNASTDSTKKKCLDYVVQDNRIHYIQQEQNIGVWRNYFFLPSKAKSEYFMWLPVGDILHPEFLKKNIQVLERDEEIVASIGRLQYIDENNKKIPEFDPYEYTNYPMKSQLDKKIAFYLRTKNSRNMGALCRTKALQKSIPKIIIPMEDRMILLNLLRFGDINVIDEVLTYLRIGGYTAKRDLIDRIKTGHDFDKILMVLPFLPFSTWFMKKFGFRLLLKNINYFIRLNFTTIWYLYKHYFKKNT
tara:strand:+ start:52 stop:900 length:849 start_codon:yes stop_codon:yes gene_type:complete